MDNKESFEVRLMAAIGEFNEQMRDDVNFKCKISRTNGKFMNPELGILISVDASPQSDCYEKEGSNFPGHFLAGANRDEKGRLISPVINVAGTPTSNVLYEKFYECLKKYNLEFIPWHTEYD
jgi:hypothetical protein